MKVQAGESGGSAMRGVVGAWGCGFENFGRDGLKKMMECC